MPRLTPSMHIVHCIARLNDGGPARVVAELAMGCSAAGHQVTVLSGQVGDDERDLTPELVATGIAVETLPRLQRRPDPWCDALALIELRRRLARLRPSLVHTHTAKAGLLGRLAARSLGLPCLHSYHGHVLHGYWRPGINLALRSIERAAARGAHCHSLTPSLVTELRDRHHVGLPWRWHCLPVPVRPVVPTEAAWQPAPGPLRLGFLGRLAPVKDIGLWLMVAAAVAKQRPIHAVICGDGAQRAWAEQRARDLGLTATFTGMVPAAEALGAMDILVMSSRNEGMPLVAVEAAGAGIPVVAPRVGGLVDLAKAGLVYGCPRRVDALSAAIGLLVDDKHLSQRHIKRAQQEACKYWPEKVVPSYLATYHNLIHV